MRLTPQRAMILEDLYHVPGHRTAEAIFASVSGRLPGLNRATVYRTLEMLHAAHVVSVFEGPDGVTGYELVGAEDSHHHLVCRECGKLLKLAAGPIEHLRADICQQLGFHADLDHLVITGLCADCAAISGAGETEKAGQCRPSQPPASA